MNVDNRWYQVALLIALSGATALASAQITIGNQAEQAWRVYGTCLAASMQLSAQLDLDAAYAESRRSKFARAPGDAARMAAKAKQVCAPFRGPVKEALLPGEFADQEEAVIAALTSIVRDMQRVWERKQYFNAGG